MAVLLVVVQWLRTLPLKVWLALLAALLLAGWLHEHDSAVRAKERQAIADRVEAREKTRLRNAVVEATDERDHAIQAARDTADWYTAKSAFITQRIAVTRVPLPVPTVTPSGDSVTFSTTAWAQHVALDAQRDSVLDDESAILRDGIPAIRNQYEAALAKDVRLFALKDSLVTNAEARVRVLTALNEGNHPTLHKIGWIMALAGAVYLGHRMR